MEESLQRMHASANWSEAEKTGRVLPSRVRHWEGPRGDWVVGRAWGVQVMGRDKGEGGLWPFPQGGVQPSRVRHGRS